MATANWWDILANRNFQNLLAGTGARLDPQGVGGALGGATLDYNKAVAAQERAATSEEAQNKQTELLLDILKRNGGLTAKGVPGVTSVSATDTGLKAEIDPGEGTQQAKGLSGPIAPVAPAPSTTPVAQAAQAVTTPAPTTLSTPTATTPGNVRLEDVIPFLFGLRGIQRP